MQAVRAVRLLLIAAWCGLSWTIGYVVAPLLFASLADRRVAGDLAAALFRIQAWVSLVVAIALVLWSIVRNRHAALARAEQLDARIIIAMLVCTAFGYFGLQPVIAMLRIHSQADAPLWFAWPQARWFAITHGAAAVFYMLQSLLGAWLLMRQAPRTA